MPACPQVSRLQNRHEDILPSALAVFYTGLEMDS